MEKQNGTCVHLPRTEPTGSPAAPRCNRLATTARKEALVFAYPVWSTGKSGGEKIAPPRRFFLRESDRLGSSVAQLIPIRSDSGVFGRRIEAMSLPQSTRELVAIGPVVFIPGFDKAGDELLRGFSGDHQAGMHQIAPGMHTGPSGDVLFKVHPLAMAAPMAWSIQPTRWPGVQLVTTCSMTPRNGCKSSISMRLPACQGRPSRQRISP